MVKFFAHLVSWMSQDNLTKFLTKHLLLKDGGVHTRTVRVDIKSSGIAEVHDWFQCVHSAIFALGTYISAFSKVRNSVRAKSNFLYSTRLYLRGYPISDLEGLVNEGSSPTKESF